MISVHGLIRGHNLELGRDADTGGQTKYVVELARAVAENPDVFRVELFTRLIEAPEVSPDYGNPRELIFRKDRSEAVIIRVPAGPTDQYLPKEALWDHLDGFVDNIADYYQQQQRRIPDVIHSHYADAGYIGSRLANILGVPLVHTGHSLGRVKRRRLLAAGVASVDIDERYNMSRRIEAEELTLAAADRVITSTHQEIEEQYGLYDHYQPGHMKVVPPGTDLALFHPPDGDEWESPIGQSIRRFLTDPDKPVILALSRPDPRKNIQALIEAFGESDALQEHANLVVIAGNRDDIGEMDEGAQEVLTELLLAIDRHDLYGKIAIPKHHQSDDVPLIYRMTALSGGVFVNPALTEPFGLTLIEAAASGLPIVATEDGGPRDIVSNCQNGILIDPLDTKQMAESLLRLLVNESDWREKAGHGLDGVREHYSWQAHANSYLSVLRPLVDKSEVIPRIPRRRRPMLYHDRAIFSDIDQNLLGDTEALVRFVKVLRENRKAVTFGIATGRRVDSAMQILRKHAVPEPDVLITSGGTAIQYGPDLTADTPWARHIDHGWTPHVVKRVLAELPGLKLQPKLEQSRFKISYYYDPRVAPGIDELTRLLHQEDLAVNVVVSFGQFLDILPIRASKGLALRWVADKWGIPLHRILAAGGSGADEDMIRGNTLAVVVANRHHEELSHLVDTDRVFFSNQSHAAGILEAIDHFDFFDRCETPKACA